jgi:hypothetical protein
VGDRQRSGAAFWLCRFELHGELVRGLEGDPSSWFMSRRVGMTGYFLRYANVLASFGITGYCSELSRNGLNKVDWIHVAQDRVQ